MKTKLLKGVLVLSVILLTVFAAQLPALAVTPQEQAAIDAAIANADTNPQALVETIAAYPDMKDAIIEATYIAHRDAMAGIIDSVLGSMLNINPELVPGLDPSFRDGARKAFGDDPDADNLIAKADELITGIFDKFIPGYAEGYSPPAPPGPAIPVAVSAGAPGGNDGLQGGCASCT
jgi:hypothetical protein